jgi:hypothetical protein
VLTIANKKQRAETAFVSNLRPLSLLDYRFTILYEFGLEYFRDLI